MSSKSKLQLFLLIKNDEYQFMVIEENKKRGNLKRLPILIIIFLPLFL